MLILAEKSTLFYNITLICYFITIIANIYMLWIKKDNYTYFTGTIVKIISTIIAFIPGLNYLILFHICIASETCSKEDKRFYY